jgi:hypothetical protein
LGFERDRHAIGGGFIREISVEKAGVCPQVLGSLFAAAALDGRRNCRKRASCHRKQRKQHPSRHLSLQEDFRWQTCRPAPQQMPNV